MKSFRNSLVATMIMATAIVLNAQAADKPSQDAPKPAVAATSRGGDVEVVRAFESNKGPGTWKAGVDAAGAVGPKHLAVLDEAAFVVQEKETGKIVKKMAPREFWNSVEASEKLDPRKDCNDPQVMYDPLSERWFAIEAGTGPETKVYLAVSATSDPSGKWKGVIVPMPPKDPGVKIGVDKNGVYISECNGKRDSHTSTNIYAIPKEDAIASGGPSVARMQEFTDLEFQSIPAQDFDPNKAADAPEVLLNSEFVADVYEVGKLYMYKVTWAGAKASISEKQAIPLSRKYVTGGMTQQIMNASQPAPGQSLRGDAGRRNTCAFVQGGSAFTCFSAKATKESRVGIVWCEVRISDGKLLQEGFVDDPKCDYIYPSLAVDAKGNIGIGCTRSSAEEFPSVCVMIRAAGDPPGKMRPPVVAMKGTTYYRGGGTAAINWSNYSSARIDPVDPGLFWTYQAYSASEVTKQWCTAWAAFRLKESAAAASAPAPKPATQYK